MHQTVRLKSKKIAKGYALLTAILAISIFSVFMMKSRTLWETTIRRDLEEELLFRGRQYVNAIAFYRKKNTNLYPQNLEILYEKKFLRRPFKDPMTKEGVWNVVMRSALPQHKNKLLIVPEEMVPQLITQASIVGVATSSCEEGYKVYRDKKKYCEWAMYVGDDNDKEMPDLKFLTEGEDINDSSDDPAQDKDSDRDKDRSDRDRERRPDRPPEPRDRERPPVDTRRERR